jgi:hypothetical protein
MTSKSELPPISGQRQQRPRLDLRIVFGRACRPGPDLAACQRIGPRLHMDAIPPARELLTVTDISARHAVTGPRSGHSCHDPFHDQARRSRVFAGGAGGTRTHGSQIMRSTAPCTHDR